MRLYNSSESRWSAEKDGDATFFLVGQFGEQRLPVRATGVGSGLEAGDEVALFLFVHQVQGQAQANGLHVCLV